MSSEAEVVELLRAGHVMQVVMLRTGLDRQSIYLAGVHAGGEWFEATGMCRFGGKATKVRRQSRSTGKPADHRAKPCGSIAAYRRHMRYGEEPCEACKEARRAHDRATYQPTSGRVAS